MAKPQDKVKPAVQGLAQPAKKVEVMPEAKAAAPKGPIQLVQVQYNKKNHHLMDHIYALVPGLNQVPKHIWEKFKEHPAAKAMIEKKEIEVADEAAE